MIPPSLTIHLYLFNIVIFYMLLFSFKEVYNGVTICKPSYKKESILFFILFTIDATFAFSSEDFWSYIPIFKDMLSIHSAIHIEPIYFWLLDHVTHNYLLWRFFVWSVSALITIWVFKRYNLNIRIAICLFVLLYLDMAITMRGALAVAIMFLGCSNIQKKTSKFQKLLGVFLIVLSYFFHRSMSISIAMLMIMLIEIKPIYIILSLIAFPVLYTFVPSVVDYIGGVTFEDDTMRVGTSIDIYTSQESAMSNLTGMIRSFLHYSAPVLALIYMCRNIVFKKWNYPTYIRRLFNYWYISTYVAFLFYGQALSNFMFTRFFCMASLPMIIVLSYHYENSNSTNRIMKLILLLALAYCMSQQLVDITHLI